jgi:Flp pilus assembly protein TadG
MVAPIIFLFFFASIEFARLNYIVHTASNAAYEGAREMMLVNSSEEDGTTAVMNLLIAASTGIGATVEIDEEPDQVTVTVNIPVDQNAWGVGRFTSGYTVSQSCTLMREIIKAED